MMGKESAMNRTAAMDAVNVIIGPVRQFRPFRACPKCGADSDLFVKRWCPGGETPVAKGLCKEFGQHLHGQCPACHFQWREECADAEDERERLARELQPKG